MPPPASGMKRQAAGGAVVLMYHRLGEGCLPGREPGEHVYAVPEAAFQEQLDALAANGCSALALEQLLELKRGDPGLAFPVAITFDDGNASDHEVALPALRARGLTAAFFVTPAWVGTPGYMGWPEIRALQADGMTVGAHGLDHTRLTTLTDGDLRKHLFEAGRMLEAELGQAPRWLALPGGFGGQREVRAAREVGFQHVLGSVPRLAHGSGTDPIPRFAIRRGDSLKAFRALVRQQTSARLQYWLRYAALRGLRLLLGARNHERLRATWAASP